MEETSYDVYAPKTSSDMVALILKDEERFNYLWRYREAQLKKKSKKVVSYVAAETAKHRYGSVDVIEEAQVRQDVADKDVAHYEVGRSAAACYNMMVG